MRRKDTEAHWIQVPYMDKPDEFVCSNCKAVFLSSGNVCPACGVEMRSKNSFASWVDESDNPTDALEGP